MFSRRSLLKGIGLGGVAASLAGLSGELRPQESGQPTESRAKMWAPNPEAEQMVRDYPAPGIKKIAIPYRARRGRVKFPNDARVAALVYVALDYFIAPPVDRPD